MVANLYRIVSLLLFITGVLADCTYIDGMYYCAETGFVQFTGVGSSGSYNRVTSFNSDGTCSSAAQGYSGNMAPFDEELSVHFRGPITLKNFKVFTKQASTNQKRALHHRHAEPEPIMITQISYDTVFVTVDGPDGKASTTLEVEPTAAVAAADEKVTTTSPEYFESSSSLATAGTVTTVDPVNTVSTASPASPESTVSAESSENIVNTVSTVSTVEPDSTTSAPAAAGTTIRSVAAAPGVQTTSATAYTEPSQVTTWIAPTTESSTVESSASASASASASSSSSNSGSGSWTEIASYNADSQSNSGLVFLNNLGGSLSGTFDYQFGNSLSYMASDGVSAAASPECLESTTVPSNHEFSIFTSTECSDGDCGFYRPGNVAYHGFGGQYKVFVFEFGMPTDDSSSFNQDMPAVWLLNAQIPRNLQYGAASCSCWSTGCGEIDLWEVLSSGNDHMLTTIHGNQDGGASTPNYFPRPTSGTFLGAAIFDGTTITVLTIPEIPSSIDDSTIESWMSQAGQATIVNM